MSAVDAGAIHSDRHLFVHGPAQPEEPPTVSPNEVVISSSYSPGSIHASVLDEDAALHHDKDFEPLDLSHDPSIQPGESTTTSIQVLDDVPDHIGVTAEDMASSDDGQDWTEGDSQEHKRVKVCLPSAPPPIPTTYLDFVRYLHASLFTPTICFCAVFCHAQKLLDPLSDSVARSTSSSALIGKTKALPSATGISTSQPTRLN